MAGVVASAPHLAGQKRRAGCATRCVVPPAAAESIAVSTGLARGFRAARLNGAARAARRRSPGSRVGTRTRTHRRRNRRLAARSAGSDPGAGPEIAGAQRSRSAQSVKRPAICRFFYVCLRAVVHAACLLICRIGVTKSVGVGTVLARSIESFSWQREFPKLPAPHRRRNRRATTEIRSFWSAARKKRRRPRCTRSSC